MYEKSLRIFAIIKYLRSFWLGSMISILFLKYIGLIDSQISLFHLIMGILIFLLEIPTGSFADKFGYKNSIILSILFLALAFLSFLIATIFGKYIILIFTTIFFSLNSAFASGAESSYIYKIFENKKEKYLIFQSKIAKNCMFIEGFAILIGNYLFSIDQRLPYFIQFILVSFAFFLSLKLKEEPRNFTKNQITSSIKFGFKEFFKNHLYFLIAFLIIFFKTPYEYFHNVINQSIFLEVGFNVTQIGFLGFVSYFFASFLVSFFPKISKKIGEKKTYLLFPVFTFFLFLSLFYFQNKFYLLFFSCFIYFIFKCFSILIDYSMQKRVNDKIRATMISIIYMFVSIPTKILFIIFSLNFSNFSYVNSFCLIGIFFMILSYFYIIFVFIPFINLEK